VSVPFTNPEILPGLIGFDGGTVGVITFVVSLLFEQDEIAIIKAAMIK
jgi:hypothetical protein